ncbi:lysosome membrane protein 2c isoform X1 [Girardinichthys multiradiatus]|uniref:lysosome membrane protein 2c isoform X1 n=2 Tax=Girardinichthys multiradiatus TaxID=208333 RepID=UPI001FAE2424|nr:lysosome membrane protein 2c isoform X1 [Girardinichthys multiradiatus]
MPLKSCCIYSIGAFSLVMLIIGISLVLSNVFPNVFQSRVKTEVVLRNGTEAFGAWADPPAPIYMQFYFFNLTNPGEVLDGERPAVVEIGPYTYREYRPMEDVVFHDNGTRVAAVNPKTYIFQRNMSRGPESDLIRTVNIPAMTVMERFKDNKAIANLIASYMRFSGIGLFTTHTVGELLWGYEDVLLKTFKTFMPELDDIFGLFYKNNASSDGDYMFFTGQPNYKDFARVDTWNGKSSLDWWTSDECNMINGTNGASFHPIISKNAELYMFSSDLCRSLYAVYTNDVTVKGISGYRFVPPFEVFANVTVNPANAGFCVPAGNCLGSGLLNVSLCKQGAPIIMSSPHFYQADEKFVQDVFGMRPKKEEHETAIDINPLTGIILQAAKRLQVNVYVEKIPDFSETGNVRTVVFPVMYLNESVLIDDGSAKKLQMIVVEKNVVENIPFMLIGVGIILGGIFMFLMCRQKVPESTSAERQPLLSS